MIEEKIHVETSFSSLIKKNEELCGDKVAIRYCDQFCILVLADGLGSGVKANILSGNTSNSELRSLIRSLAISCLLSLWAKKRQEKLFARSLRM